MSEIMDLHDTNVYEKEELILLNEITDLNLNIIKNNSLLFLKNVSDNLIKKINIRGFQYCFVKNENVLNEIPLNFIITNNELNNLNNIQTYILKDKNTLKCLKCNHEIKTLELCKFFCYRSEKVKFKESINSISNKSESDIDINLIYTLSEPIYNKTDKFQDSMLRDAVRLDFAMKRENYKKHMKQVSSVKSNNTSISSNSSIKQAQNSIKICKAITKKGVKCTNKCIKNSEYCGILAHSS